MSEEGLGKGLNALISSKGHNVAKGTKGYMVIREKEKALESLEGKISKKKDVVEDLRKKLTIELMLNGKVDKTELNKLEEEMDVLVSEKKKLISKIKDLKAEMSIDFNDLEETHSREKESTEITEAISETIGSDIDMRMVRELMVEEEEPDEDDIFIPEAEDQEHVEKLKRELDRTKVAEVVRKEAYGDQDPNGTDQKRRVIRRTVKSPTTPRSDAVKPEGSVLRKVVEKTGQGQEKGPVRKKRIVRKIVRKIPRLDDKEVLSVVKRALYLTQSGDLEEAKDILESALEKDKTNDEILYHLGNIYFIKEDWETAEYLFTKSIEKNDRSYRAYNNLGVVQRKLGKKQSAIRSLNASIELEPNYERAWMNLGTLYMELDPPMLTEASIFLRRAIECQPNYRKAREKLDRCQRMMEM